MLDVREDMGDGFEFCILSDQEKYGSFVYRDANVVVGVSGIWGIFCFGGCQGVYGIMFGCWKFEFVVGEKDQSWRFGSGSCQRGGNIGRRRSSVVFREGGGLN